MMERTKWENGPHRVWFEAPDILHITAEAVVQPSESIEATRIANEEVAPHVGEFFLFVHLYPGGALGPGARKAAAGAKPTWSGVVIVGGSALARAVVNATMRAMSLLSGKQPPSRMVKTDEEAYAFIKELRSANRDRAANA